MDNGDGCTVVRIYLMSLNCKLKMGKGYTLFIFYCKKKSCKKFERYGSIYMKYSEQANPKDTKQIYGFQDLEVGKVIADGYGISFGEMKCSNIR